MSLRPILIIPDSRLRLLSEPVERFDDGLRTLVGDMFAAMYAAPGIGLAAIQVGVPKRLITLDLARKDEARKPLVIVNPEILSVSDEKKSYEEGCLSIPEYYEPVERPLKVRVRHLDEHGKEQIVDAEGLLATCLQHEIDHLNGVLFIDHISKLKRDRVIKKFVKLAKRAEA